ncbi:unnamed protein product, partial [Prorocentrum cordatum]
LYVYVIVRSPVHGLLLREPGRRGAGAAPDREVRRSALLGRRRGVPEGLRGIPGPDAGPGGERPPLPEQPRDGPRGPGVLQARGVRWHAAGALPRADQEAAPGPAASGPAAV